VEGCQEKSEVLRLIERWRLIPASGEHGGIEARLRRFDGEYRWFLVCSSPLQSAHSLNSRFTIELA
jgi:PAS domain-containing protein